MSAANAEQAPWLRAAVPEDAAAIAILEGEAFPHPWNQAQLAAELRQPAALGLVAEVAGLVVGYALFRRILDEAELLRLAVVPARRRQGLARALVERGLAQLRGTGCRHTFLEVREDNRGAILLYERSGWQAAGRRPAYYPDGTGALLYRRSL